ncbi:MAG: hypothetical protein AB7M93_30015 [Candidatus Obscuribacterales bacterium]
MELHSKSSRYLLQISHRDLPSEADNCQRGTYKALLGTAAFTSAATEAFWVPVYLEQGSGGIQYFVAMGSATSMIALKFFCYKDIIDAGQSAESSEEREALGIHASRIGTYGRLLSSFATSLVILFPIAWQVGNDNHSVAAGLLGGYGDTPICQATSEIDPFPTRKLTPLLVIH